MFDLLIFYRVLCLRWIKAAIQPIWVYIGVSESNIIANLLIHSFDRDRLILINGVNSYEIG